MEKERPFVHPYIPNSVPEIKEEMLRFIGVDDIETLYEEIPKDLRFKGRLNLPAPFVSEYDLKKHVASILLKNKTCEENLSFLGGGVWQHYVPALCDEIIGRSEVLTAYSGEQYSDFGKFQLFFEYQSELAELLAMDAVCLPVYTWGVAAGNAVRMASRLTGRNEVLLPKTVGPERLATIRTFCHSVSMPGHIDVTLVDHDPASDLLNMGDLRSKISSRTAAVYFENPSYLGSIETRGQEISEIAHANGAQCIVGVDPISLGILAPPAAYGADITVGTIQPLGVHMQCGGGCAGFIAHSDDERYVSENPAMIVSMAPTIQEGEYGFGWSGFDVRTSYASRDSQGRVRVEAKDFTGTSSNLWAIGAATYMALMGPAGFKAIGETIIQRSHYAAQLLSSIDGVEVPLGPNFFKEFVVNFDKTGRSVAEVNKALLAYNIFGGKDISRDFSELGNSALYCVTEIHAQEDIQKLAEALKEVLK